MKKNIRIYVAFFAMVVVLFSCKKDTEVNKDTFKIEDETVEAGTQSVRIAGSYAYGGVIDAITLELGRQSDLMDGDAYRAILDGTDYSVEVGGLRTSTTYYYRYLVDYGGKTPYATETKSFATLDYNLPEVETKEVESVGVNRAAVRGEVKSDGGGDAVTLRGVCWGTRHNPSVGDEYSNAGEGEGAYTCELTNLQPEKTYYARAFAGNSKGIAYGAELTFVTLKAGTLAEVHTLGIVGNAMLEATVEGEVTAEGASAVLERGVCYGKEHYPLTSGLHVASGTGTGVFTSHLTNLEAGSTYYVRAYAINSLGVSYGEEMSFVAQTEMTVPVVVTNMVKDITESSATGSGVVVSDGGSSITRRGLCWSEQPDPTINDTHADCGVGAGAFNCLMPHLSGQTTYYVRAYAENAVGLAYGELVSFTVGQHGHIIPTVVTGEVSDITSTSAVGRGNVTNDGGTSVTERGLCWSTSHSPTISGDHASNGMGTGNYTVNITGLTDNTIYYVRAYATNSEGTAYGSEVSFTTSGIINMPTVTTSEITNITHNSAQGGGNVTDNGGASVTERGLCWSMRPDPTIDGAHASNGTGTGSYIVNMTGLSANTIYYVRAYATNSVGTAYGEEVQFRTDSDSALPTVLTSVVSNITQTTATGGGNVTSDGGATVTERGICWSTSHNPTTSGSHTMNGTGMGEYTVNMRDLVPNTTYYVRAYAKNSNGESYGGEESFVTSAIPQYTINVSANPSNGGMVTGGGTYQQGQQCTVTAMANSGYAFTNWTENGSVVSTDASYTFTVTGNRTLVANFTLQTSLPTVITNAVTNITQTTATGGGNVTNDGNATVTERGICWSTSPNPTTDGNHASSGSGIGNFAVEMNNLTPNTTYYVRAYARNLQGISYGDELSFNTMNLVVPIGAVNGLFSVSDYTQVFFSQGNLQYQASTQTWRFAINQWDYVGSEIVDGGGDPGGTVSGSSNHLISSYYNGWIDLFGWATSGYNHGSVCYQPYSTSTNGDYYFAYGSSSYNLYEQTGQADWGYNAILNGGNVENTWRTLTYEEWMYLFFTRNTASGIRFVKSQVNDVNGVVLLPDDWNSNYYSLNSTNSQGANYDTNIISATEWTEFLEANGAVFLPAAGHRYGTYVYLPARGRYWSSSSSGGNAWGLWFGGGDLSMGHMTNYLFVGQSIRLVQDAGEK